ncbi:MAG: hypothetical protein CFE32_05525 [Alphaproteobacteria bacterium PA3]|nr:MAG: hypothetical protein CFE32_05525 [Alphaproteobacteria bacterium PA3]
MAAVQIAFAQGRFHTAYKTALHGLLDADDDTRLLHLLSEICIRVGANQHASDFAQAAVARDPSIVAALAIQIEACIREGHLQQAQQMLHLLPRADDVDAWHRLMTLRLNLAQGDFELALLEIANLVESTESPVLARELFYVGFKMFKEGAPADRFDAFVDALGLMMPDVCAEPEPWALPQVHSVDVIIPVHNALTDLAECLVSIRRCTGSILNRIILVDDASDRVTSAWLDRFAARNADTILIRTPANLGFTRSVIAGIAESHAPYFVLLNSDTIVTPGWLDGLWRGLSADRSHAMAGPLSNNAYFQTLTAYGDVEDKDSAARSSMPDHIAALMRASAAKPVSKVPFLGGFCLMIRRDHYNSVGGLDALSYPRGYWEVQDLALRLIDRGLYPCLVADVFVMHRTGRSISADDRTALTTEGFRNIIGRHGTIRVLAAEELCRLSAEVARQNDVVKSFAIARRHTPEPDLQVVSAAPKYRWQTTPLAHLAGPDVEICLFVAYAPFGVLADYTARYLQELRHAGLKVVTCLIVDDLSTPAAQSWESLSDAVLLRENGGYDFGAWADLLRACPSLFGAKRLIFANDSMVGPFSSLRPLFDRIRAEDAGFFALTDCTIKHYHTQSFFFGWNARNLASPVLQTFWRMVENLADKNAVILQYELSLISLCESLDDPSHQVLFPMEQVFGPFARDLPPFSPVHNTWQAMFAAGMPFIKASLLDPDRIDEVCTLTGACRSMLTRHVEQTKLNRM